MRHKLKFGNKEYTHFDSFTIKAKAQASCKIQRKKGLGARCVKGNTLSGITAYRVYIHK